MTDVRLGTIWIPLAFGHNNLINVEQTIMTPWKNYPTLKVNTVYAKEFVKCRAGTLARGAI